MTAPVNSPTVLAPDGVRIKDVARRAGVSPSTVSHVLNGTRFVSQEKRQRVLDCIRELRYEPSALARSLRRKETLTIGVIVSDANDPFFTAVLRGIEDVAQRAGYSVIVGNSDEQQEKQERYLHSLASRQVDGFIVAPTGGQSPALEAASSRGTPVVGIDRHVHGVAASVGINNEAAAFQVIDHLVRDGHTRIGVIAGLPDLSTTVERLHGYHRALQMHGIDYDPSLVETGGAGPNGGAAAAHRLLNLPQPPTALFATTGRLTLGALVALHELGAACPGDVGLAGMDDHEWAAVSDPPLTVIRQPAYLIGERAAGLLLERLQGRPVPEGEIILPAQLIVRASCSDACAAAFREHSAGWCDLSTKATLRLWARRPAPPIASARTPFDLSHSPVERPAP